jgi:hypothetical protein
MRLTVLATAAVSSVVALVGFAGAVQASATVDLIWIDVSNTDPAGDPICLRADERNCPQRGVLISSVAMTDNITLGVIVTAGPKGFMGGGVSVNYGDALPKLSVTQFQTLTTPVFLPKSIGTTTNQTPYINNISSICCAALAGIGLPPGGTAYLGTVTFHKDFVITGAFEISVGTDGPGGTDALLGLDPLGDNITGTSTFNSAFVINTSVDPPPCVLQIEVNALRAGAKMVRTGPKQSVNVTAKARILKGTAAPDTTIDTELTIEARDGAEVIGTNSTGPIRLGVGKGGKGAKLPLDVPQCDSGYIDFNVRFWGVDTNREVCVGARTLRKACR